MTQKKDDGRVGPGRATAALRPAEQLSLWAIRAWVARRQLGLGPCPGFYRAFRCAGAPAAAGHMVAFLDCLADKAWRAIEINCPRCLETTLDEERLIAALAAIQRDQHGRASDLLSSFLLPHAIDESLPELRRFGAALDGAGLPFPDEGDSPAPSAPTVDGRVASRCPDRGASLLH